MRFSLLVRFAIALCFVACVACVQPTHAQESGRPALPEIQAAWETHQAALRAVAADRDKKLANLDYIYRLNLEKLQNDRAAAGDLDGALAAKTELDRLSAHQALTDEQRKAMNPALQALRASY